MDEPGLLKVSVLLTAWFLCCNGCKRRNRVKELEISSSGSNAFGLAACVVNLLDCWPQSSSREVLGILYVRSRKGTETEEGKKYSKGKY